MPKDVGVVRDLTETIQLQFSLALLTTPEQIGAFALRLALKAEGDAILWFA